VRSKITVPAGTPEDEIKNKAMSDEKIKGLIGEKAPKKVFVVKEKLVNIVI